MEFQRFSLRYGKTIVYFGVESAKNLETMVCRYKRVYIVTSRSAARVSKALYDILNILNMCNTTYEIFDEVKPNPMYSAIEQVAEEIKKFNTDVVIAIGGGSVIDSAKIASAIAICGGTVKEYVLENKQICGTKPLIAINLTHGTGSEVNRYAVATIDTPRTKFGIASEYFYPLASIDDPKYTLSLPLNQTIYTSLDAFYHVYEAATGKDTSPFVLAVAEEAVKHIVYWLPKVVKNPSDIESRYWLLYSSMLAGIAIDNSRAHLIHAIENVISGINTDLPHGAGLAILGPHAIKYIHRAVPEYSYRILKYIDPHIKPEKDYAEKASKIVAEFQNIIGFKERLSDYGFKENDIDVITTTVFKYLTYGLKLTPFNVKEDDIRNILLESI